MAVTKGIILAGGQATRLHPATLAFGKPLLPVFDKPMIYYSLTLLIEAGIREVLIITTPRDIGLYRALFGDGAHLGMRITYQEQPVSRGIADAFLIGESFAGGDPVCLMLGDNFFYTPEGETVAQSLARAGRDIDGAMIFCTEVEDPRAYGVATLDAAGNVTKLVEKPAAPESAWAATGLYLYSAGAAAAAKTLTPSARGELEITDLNIRYMNDGRLKAQKMSKGTVWFDLGTHEAMLEAGAYIRAEEKRRGAKIGCPDSAAFAMKFIDADQLRKNAGRIKNPAYAAALLARADKG